MAKFRIIHLMRYLAIIFLLTACLSALSYVEGNRYSTKEYGCSLQAPEGWTLLLSIDSFFAKVESEEKDMACGVSAQLFKDPVPIGNFIAGIEQRYGVYKKGQSLESYLKPTIDRLAAGEETRRKLYESLIYDDAPSPAEIEKAEKEAEDRGGISDIPEQTMASRIYKLPLKQIEPPLPPSEDPDDSAIGNETILPMEEPEFGEEVSIPTPTEQEMIIYYVVRRSVGYHYVFFMPAGEIVRAAPYLQEILGNARLKNLSGGRYAIPDSVPEGPPKFGLIQGKVLRNGMSVGGVKIALYRKREDIGKAKAYMSTKSSYGGAFMITNIPPGHYYALSPINDGDSGKPVYNIVIQEGRAFLTNIELSP